MRKSGFINGFMMGSLLGGLLALLLTPDTGENVRSQARGFVQNFGSDVRKAAAERRTQLEMELENLRTPRKSEPD